MTRSELVYHVDLGLVSQEPVATSGLWLEDFSHAWLGRCYTMRLNRKLGPDYRTDELFLHLNPALNYYTFVHDPDYFIINSNPVALPVNRKIVSPNTSSSHYYHLSLTQQHQLSVARDPCEPAEDYSFLACVRRNISRQVRRRHLATGGKAPFSDRRDIAL